MTDFRIDTGIPVPRARGGHGLKYPFGQMQVGQSWLASPDTGGNALRVRAHQCGREYGMKFVVRKTKEGFRVWRTA